MLEDWESSYNLFNKEDGENNLDGVGYSTQELNGLLLEDLLEFLSHL